LIFATEAVTPDGGLLVTWIACFIFVWGAFREGLNGLKWLGVIQKTDATATVKKLDDYVHTNFHRVNGELHRQSLELAVLRRDLDDSIKAKVESVDAKLGKLDEKLDATSQQVARLDERTIAILSKVDEASGRRAR
jgi:hypothetical protein